MEDKTIHFYHTNTVEYKNMSLPMGEEGETFDYTEERFAWTTEYKEEKRNYYFTKYVKRYFHHGMKKFVWADTHYLLNKPEQIKELDRLYKKWKRSGDVEEGIIVCRA